MNRFKRLDLVDRVPEQLGMEVHKTVQEAVTKTNPKKKKCEKIKWLSEEALQIAEERRELKEREKWKDIQWNPEFQRIAGRDKKTLLNKQCKGIEENNRREKSRDLFKKIGGIKGTYHARMGTIKGRNGKDLTDAKEIRYMWQRSPVLCSVKT